MTKTGTGSGTVTSSPAGINCGTDCTENYNSSTSVTLTAAATTGSTFTGWSGALQRDRHLCRVTMSGRADRDGDVRQHHRHPHQPHAREHPHRHHGHLHLEPGQRGRGVLPPGRDHRRGPARCISASTGTAPSATVAGLPGGSVPVYVRLWSRFGTTWQYNDYTFTATSGAGSSKAALTSPTPGSTLPATSATFTWSPGSGVAEYFLQVGTTAGGDTLYSALDRHRPERHGGRPAGRECAGVRPALVPLRDHLAVQRLHLHGDEWHRQQQSRPHQPDAGEHPARHHRPPSPGALGPGSRSTTSSSGPPPGATRCISALDRHRPERHGGRPAGRECAGVRPALVPLRDHLAVQRLHLHGDEWHRQQSKPPSPARRRGAP